MYTMGVARRNVVIAFQANQSRTA